MTFNIRSIVVYKFVEFQICWANCSVSECHEAKELLLLVRFLIGLLIGCKEADCICFLLVELRMIFGLLGFWSTFYYSWFGRKLRKLTLLFMLSSITKFKYCAYSKMLTANVRTLTVSPLEHRFNCNRKTILSSRESCAV